MPSISLPPKSLVLALAALLPTLFLSGCASEGERLMREGASPEYAKGYDDGCSSGKKAAGDMFSQFHKNIRAYQANGDYRQGWNDGHEECKSELMNHYRQQEIGIQQQRAYDEHKWLENQNQKDMVKDAMPTLSKEELETLKKLSK